MLKKFKSIAEKDKILIKNISGSFIIKGFSFFLSFATLPSYMRFFDDESALGLWFTIVSVLTWILTFDIGIGNGLRNHLTASLTLQDFSSAKKYISSAYCSIGAIALIIIACFVSVFKFLNWNKILNISSQIIDGKTLKIAILIVFLGIIFQFFGGIISSILYALQLSSVTNLISLIRSVVLILFLNIIPSSNDNNINLLMMALLNCLVTVFPLLLVTVIIFNTKLKSCRPSFSGFEKKYAKDLLSLGSKFLISQIFYTIIMTNEYFITIFSDNSNVVDYQIYHKPFALVSTLFSLALVPVWSAVTKALFENDILWIRKLLKKSFALAIMISICELIAVPFLQIFFDLWLGKNHIQANLWHALSFALLFSFMNINTVFSCFTNGTGKIKVQIICFSIGAILKIPLSFVLVNLFDSWIGVVLANVIALSIYCIIQPFFLKKSVFVRQAESTNLKQPEVNNSNLTAG